MKHIIPILLLLTTCGLANAAEPDVLEKFFGHTGIKDKHSVYHGEMLKYFLDKPTLGEGLPNNVQATFRKLDESAVSQVYAVLLSDGRNTQDWYAFLVKDNDTWKISAVRSLALPSLFYMALQELEGKSPRSPDEEWQYRNMLLAIKHDSELKEYLKQNVSEFDNIVSPAVIGNKEQSEKIAKRLYISSVRSNADRIELAIGGIIDNTVGYLYVPPGAEPPTMTPSGYIYVEKIVGRWYLYKTT